MARFRFWGLTLLVVALSYACLVGKSEGQKPAQLTSEPPTSGWRRTYSSQTTPAADQTCTIYSLHEMADDPKLGTWIAETIPQVIEPGTWNGSGPGTASYFYPKKILVVYHTPAVQAKVEGFLKDLKKASAQCKEGMLAVKDRMVVPAKHEEPGLLKASNPVPEQHPTYLVPGPVRQPKHLFHFIIRYEGEGIVDSNVVEAIKAQNSQNSSAAPPLPILPPNLTQAAEPTVAPVTGESSIPTLPPPKEVKEVKETAKPSVDKKDKGAKDTPAPERVKKGTDKEPT